MSEIKSYTISGMPQSWNDRRTVTTSELTLRYGIPREELDSFQSMLRIYPNNWTIIQEGARDKSLYLVRVGKVGIFREIAGGQEQIGSIEAVNFLGEMSLINDEPRSATARVESDVAIVYEIASPNMSLILRNAKWAELLVSRLCRNLAEKNAQNVAAALTLKKLQDDLQESEKQLDSLRQENQHLLRQAELAFNAVLNFQNLVRDLAVVGSRGWAYLKAMGDATRYLAGYYLPMLRVSETGADPKVMKTCVDSLQKHHPPSILDDLKRGN